MGRSRLVAISLALAALVPAVAAPQTEGPDAAPLPAGTAFLANYRFHLEAVRLIADGVAFDWTAEFGGDVDLVDFGRGRLNGLAAFEAILGHERGPFDPTQGNYTLALTLVWRVRGSEVGAVFHHVSRHLSDRAKAFPVDWNMLGVAAQRRVARGPIRLETATHLLVATKRSFVDYRTEVGARAVATQPLGGRTTLFAGGELTVRSVTRRIFDRGALVGGRFESGVRLAGARAGLDLFTAVERRIDADPLDLRARTWALVGFRIVNR